MKKIILNLSIILCFSVIAFSQPRPVDKSTDQNTPPKPAPASFAAKYEGGLFGFNKKEEGTLKFDDDNERLVFLDKDQKEKFALPYKAMLVIFPQSQSVQSNSGKVISVLPLPGAGILGGFVKEKRSYLIISFDDPDVEAKGLVNFKLADKALLDSVIFTLAEKAELKQRGDAYFRPRPATKTDDSK